MLKFAQDRPMLLDQTLSSLTPQMKALLRRCLQIPSVSGHEKRFVESIDAFAREHGLITDMWIARESELGNHPVVCSKHLPLADRPTLVIGLPHAGEGRSLMFNAHSDVVAAGDESAWTVGAWSGSEKQGRVYGRGACDVKGPLVSALWAMLALHKTYPRGLPGAIKLELVPGEEDCVTLGTITSIARGHTADACIVLEPTECQPRNASRPGVRFEITCAGRAVHGTVKWLGEDAIVLAHQAITVLQVIEMDWNDPHADPLFARYPITRPITLDLIKGGEWQGMVCDRCRLAGYLELLPGDDPAAWCRRFTDAVLSRLPAQDRHRVAVAFPEVYLGHRIDSANSLCKIAELVTKVPLPVAGAASWSGWSGFNSGCEAGCRANVLSTPTLVWGPGSLAQAHAVDEFVEFDEVQWVAGLFARTALSWTGLERESI